MDLIGVSDIYRGVRVVMGTGAAISLGRDDDENLEVTVNEGTKTTYYEIKPSNEKDVVIITDKANNAASTLETFSDEPGEKNKAEKEALGWVGRLISELRKMVSLAPERTRKDYSDYLEKAEALARQLSVDVLL